MAATCDPGTIADSAKCYCYDPRTNERVMIYLLLQIAGLSMTPTELQAASKCYCLDPISAQKAMVYLLCQIYLNGGGGGAGQIVEYTTTDPTTDGVFPANLTLPAIAYHRTGVNATWNWNTVAQAWV